jgi:hypothetical protein
MAQRPRKPPLFSTRRYPRFSLDLDWFVESSRGCSTLGRGLELSVRGALLPACRSPFEGQVTLFVALPQRPEMFRATCEASLHDGRGWVLRFVEVAPDDLQLLGQVLLAEFGAAALPELERRAAHDVVLA